MKALYAAVFILLAVAVAAAEDFYSLLKITRSATSADVKKAFKKLARELHPDTAKDAAERERKQKSFVAVTEAYEVLYDEKRRAAYDESGGRRTVSQGDDRNYLRYNLFNEFQGRTATEDEITKAIQGGAKKPFAVFFWSANFPESIDAAPAYKNVAAKMSGTTIAPTHFKCDDAPHVCRQVVQDVPALVLFLGKNRFRYEGKFEVQAITDFFTKRLKNQIRKMSYRDLEVCPPADLDLQLYRETRRIDLSLEAAAFEFTPCFGCESETLIALDTIRRSFPNLHVTKIACKGAPKGSLCNRLQEKDRAWTLTSVSISDYITFNPATRMVEVVKSSIDALAAAPPKTLPSAVTISKFDGRFSAIDLVNFITSTRPSLAVQLNAQRLKNLKKSNDSFAILLHHSDNTREIVQWSLLAASVNKIAPYRSKRGRLRALIIDCSKAANSATCSSLGGGAVPPVVAVFPFGLVAKGKAPAIIQASNVGWSILYDAILEEVEPLHLHILTPKNYDAKVSKSLASKSPKKWLVLFNAGKWCPPCNQMRGFWRDAVRTIQNSDLGKKVSMGLVECDEHKNLCGQLDIQSYPTLVFLSKGRPRLEFNGNRDAKSVVEWVAESMDSRLVSLHPQELMQRIHSGKTIVVSWTAGKWCPPCTQLSPQFKQASNKIGDIPAMAVNCDDMRDFCMQQGIEGYPTVILYHKGQKIIFESYGKSADMIADWVKRSTQ